MLRDNLRIIGRKTSMVNTIAINETNKLAFKNNLVITKEISAKAIATP